MGINSKSMLSLIDRNGTLCETPTTTNTPRLTFRVGRSSVMQLRQDRVLFMNGSVEIVNS